MAVANAKGFANQRDLQGGSQQPPGSDEAGLSAIVARCPVFAEELQSEVGALSCESGAAKRPPKLLR